MTDEDYEKLRKDAENLLAALKAFPAHQLLREEDARNIRGVGVRIWAAYLESCT